jgi:hydroxymethylbilane synthase
MFVTDLTPLRPPLSPIRVVTRQSALALTQTQWVIDQLRAAWPGLVAELVFASTPGDRDKSTPLTTLGQGVFVKGVEEMLLDGRADVAVHSLKDVPTILTPGLELAAFPRRADPRDGLVCRAAVGRSLAELPPRARVGTGSPRRAAQLLAMRPDLRVSPIRGNLDTRLAKLHAGEFDALALAVAGLERLGRLDELAQVFEVDECTPCVGQGTLAVQCRSDAPAIRALVARIADPAARAASIAERSFLAALGGGCELPAGALGTVSGANLDLVGVVASADGRDVVRQRKTGRMDDPAQFGRQLAHQLLPRARTLIGAAAGSR